jgi:hypothetical protein
MTTNFMTSPVLLDCRLTKIPAAGTAWQDRNQSARETDTQVDRIWRAVVTAVADLLGR